MTDGYRARSCEEELVCEVCGSVVERHSIDTHDTFHTTLDSVSDDVRTLAYKDWRREEDQREELERLG